MVKIRKHNPVTYNLCTDTVTVYHKDGQTIRRAVHNRAFFDHKKTVNVDKTGSAESSGFLLVIPGDAQTVWPGDKIIRGEGPEVTAETYAHFIPGKVPGLVVADYVDVKYWAGQIVHTEAGGK